MAQALEGELSMAVTTKNMKGRLVGARQVRATAPMAFDAGEGARVIEKVVMTSRAADRYVAIVREAHPEGSWRRSGLEQEPARTR